MATLEQLETALRNADAAGDTDAATALAAEYQRVRGLQPAQGSQPSTGVVAGFREGLANAVGGVGETLKQYGGVDTSMKDTAAKLAPQNYQPAPVIDKDGVHAGNLPQAVAEGAPGMAADIAAMKLASKVPVIGKYAAIPAGIASYLLRTRGQAAVERAQNRTGDQHAEPNAQDKAVALATGAVESIPQALTIGRFAPGAGAVTATGMKGVGQAAGELAKTAGIAGVGSAASDAASQVGSTIGTDKGVQVDPLRSLNAGATGLAAGALLKAPRTTAEAGGAIKYRNITPELNDAAARVSNRIVEAADGGDLASPKTAGAAFEKAHAGLNTELGNAVRDLKSRVTLGPDAENAFNSLKSGASPSAREMDAIKAAVQGDPAAQQVLELARDSHAMSVLKGTGKQHNGAFVGGLATKVASLGGLTTHGTTKAIAATLAADTLGSHLITYSPAMLGALGGAYGAGYLVDKVTGNRSPVNRFVQRFSDPSKGVRPQAPVLPQVSQSPSGPKIAQVQMPWGNAAPFAPATGDPHAEQIKDASALMAARRANAALAAAQSKQQQRDATEQMNARRANAVMASRQVSQEAQGVQEQARDAQALMQSRKANATLAKLAAMAEAQGTREQQNDAQALVAARAANARMGAQTQKAQQQDATDIVASRKAYLDENIKSAMDLMDARRANAKLDAASEEGAAPADTAAPAAPIVVPKATISARALGKIKKPAGSEKVNDSTANAAPEAEGYQPLSPEQMPYRGVPLETRIAKELSKYEPALRKVYGKKIAAKHNNLKAKLAEISGDWDLPDQEVAGELFNQLDHTKTGKDAADAVSHYAKLLSPGAAAELTAKFGTGAINAIWAR